MKTYVLTPACLLAALLMTGCKKPVAADCGAAIAEVATLSNSDPAMAGVTEETRGKLSTLMMRHCNDDKWSKETTACMSEAKTTAELSQCDALETPQQRDAVQQSVQRVLAKAAARGSAIGSGSAGSAGSAVIDLGSAAGDGTTHGKP